MTIFYVHSSLHVPRVKQLCQRVRVLNLTVIYNDDPSSFKDDLESPERSLGFSSVLSTLGWIRQDICITTEAR